MDGVPNDYALSFEQAAFGRVYRGESVHTLFVIMNSSSTYSLRHVKVKVSVDRFPTETKSNKIDKNARPLTSELKVDELIPVL